MDTQGYSSYISGSRTEYSCSHCTYTSSHLTHMKYHLVKHSGTRLFKCDICQKDFSRKSSLGRHLRKIHQQE